MLFYPKEVKDKAKALLKKVPDADAGKHGERSVPAGTNPSCMAVECRSPAR